MENDASNEVTVDASRKQRKRRGAPNKGHVSDDKVEKFKPQR